MKPITLRQWKKMTARQRSWLVCKTMGERASVYWHCIGADGATIGGSYQNKAFCDRLINSARGLTADEAARDYTPFPHPLASAHPEPSVAFPLYAKFDHLAVNLIAAMVNVDTPPFRLRTNGRTCTVWLGHLKAAGGSIQEASCLLFLKSHKLVKEAA